MKKPLQIALKKIKHYPDWKQWGGCLSYASIVALADDGWKEAHGTTWEDYARRNMAEGKNGCTWIYYERIGNHAPVNVQKPDAHGKKND